MNNNLDFTDVDYVSPAAISEGFDFLKEFGLYEFETHVECSKALGEAIRLTQVIPRCVTSGISDKLERQLEHRALFREEHIAEYFGSVAQQYWDFEFLGVDFVETEHGPGFIATVRGVGNLSLTSSGTAVLQTMLEVVRQGGEYLGWAPCPTDSETWSLTGNSEDEPD